MAKETRSEDHQPTPPIGWPIIWHKNPRQADGPICAFVTAIEDVGKLTIVAFPPRSMPVHTMGVLHLSNPVHAKPASIHSIKQGAWDFINPEMTPRNVYRMAKERDERREAKRKESEKLNALEAVRRENEKQRLEQSDSITS